MSALGVLGTGTVGQAIARRAAEVGYQVTVGARTAASPSLGPFAGDETITTGSFADAIRSAPMVVNATSGSASVTALGSAGAEALHGKVVLDLANDLAPVAEGYPRPVAAPDQSLGRQIQRAFPHAHVVKALNTMNAQIMIRPNLIPGDHLAFLCGDSPDAKDEVSTLLRAFGWREPQLMDLGGIDAAVATEMMMHVWMRVTILRGPGAPRFNWAVLSAPA